MFGIAALIGGLIEVGIAIYRKISGVVVGVLVILPLITVMVAAATTAISYLGLYNQALTTIMSAAHSALAGVPVGTSNLDCWASAMGLFDDIKIIIDAVATALGGLIAQWVAGWIYRAAMAIIGATKS